MIKFMLLMCALIFTPLLPAKELRFVTEDLPPFQFINENQQVDGAIVELLYAMLKESRLSANIDMYPWARSYQMALSRPNTILFSMFRAEHREENFHWIGKLYSLNSYLAALKSRSDITIKDFNDAKKYRVGAIRGGLGESYLKEKGFISKKNYYASSKYNILWGQLFKGGVDIVFTNGILWEYELRAEGYDPKDLVLLHQVENMASDLYMVASLNTKPDIIDKLTKALEKLKENGQYQAILEKWQL